MCESSAFSLAHYHEHVQVKCVLSHTHCHEHDVVSQVHDACVGSMCVFLSFFFIFLVLFDERQWMRMDGRIDMEMDEDGWKDRHRDG